MKLIRKTRTEGYIEIETKSFLFGNITYREFPYLKGGDRLGHILRLNSDGSYSSLGLGELLDIQGFFYVNDFDLTK